MVKLSKLAFCLLILLAFGCASGTKRYGANINEVNQKILRENEQRINTLENSISALNAQVAQLNNRVYEVRTRTGQKTSMTVVPITPQTPPDKTVQPTANSAADSTQAAQPRPTAPVGKKIDPKASPAPMTNAVKPQASAKPAAGRSGSVGTPARAAGPNGQLGQDAALDDLGLPPADLPPVAQSGTSIAPSSPTIAQLPGDNSARLPVSPQATRPVNTNVPVPSLNNPDLSLPPENNLETPAQTSQVQNSAPVPPARGEEAAYNTALRAARSGHIPEAITLFRNFLNQYPNGRYRANADYWLGECLYSQGKLEDALAQFQNVNTAFPTHQKNADALLKAGMTMSRMGDQSGAREKYRTLINSFPNSEAARRARAMGNQ